MIKHDYFSKIYFKPTILFLIANILTFFVHELSHAMTAFFLGIPAELFPFYTNISKQSGTIGDQALISVMGPFVSLIIGLTSLVAFRHFKPPTLKLFLLYTYILGVSIFFGNMFSASMAGDFNRFFNLLEFPISVKIVITTIGLILLIWFMYGAGSNFVIFKFYDNYSKISTILSTIVFPWTIGTLLLIICYLPLSRELITVILLSSSFGVFSLMGALKNTTKTNIGAFQISKVTYIEIISIILCITITRLIGNGISFSP